jgi:ribosomal protein L7/L12
VLEAELTSAVQRIEKRLDWIEENLASIGRVSGREYVPMGRGETRPDATGVPADVLELARAGKTIDAIKRYRELTGLDFTHAREAIDNL